MKKNLLHFFLLLFIVMFSSCSEKTSDLRTQLVDGVIGYLEGKGFACDTTFNDVTNEKTITVSQRELFMRLLPEYKEEYENGVKKILRFYHVKAADEKYVTLNLAHHEPNFYNEVTNLCDSLKDYIVNLTSLEPNGHFGNPTVHGYKWVYDNLQCELTVHKNIMETCCEHLSLIIAMTNDRYNETEQIEYETSSQDPCMLLIKKLYEDYVLFDDLNATRNVEPFENVVDEMFTKKGKQKLIDAYDYELEPGQVGYALWEMRTGAQDSSDEDVAQQGIKEILPIGNNQYIVKYSDHGFESETLIIFAEENGKLKIDDFKTDKSMFE